MRIPVLCIIGVCAGSFDCRTLFTTNQSMVPDKQSKLDTLLEKVDQNLVAQIESWLHTHRDACIEAAR